MHKALMAFPARVPGPQTVLAFVEDVVEKLANDTEDLLLRFDEVVVGIQFTCEVWQDCS